MLKPCLPFDLKSNQTFGGDYTDNNIFEHNASDNIFSSEAAGKNISDSDMHGKNNGAISDIFEWLDVFVKAIIIVVFLFTAVFKIATIEGRSMENTVFEGEKVILTNLFYDPKPGDIVIVSRNYQNLSNCNERRSQPIIKRVIAVEGQTVDIDFASGIVCVDGKALRETYTKTPTNLSYDVQFPITVEKGNVFLLGDNRNESLDSRAREIGADGTGQVDKRYILGRVISRIYPLNKFGKLE